jgi:hypothetical protein
MSTSREIKLLSTRWITYSALGMLMMAAGLVVLMEAIVMRVNGSEPSVFGGVLLVAIIIFVAGISFIGTSIKYRIYLDRKRKQDSEFKSPHAGSRSSSGEHKSRSHSHRSKSSAES